MFLKRFIFFFIFFAVATMAFADELKPLPGWESAETKAKVDQKLAEVDAVIQKGPFKDDWDSLRQHEVPDWYRDAKFGIFIHWGLYSVPAYANEWYSRDMYQQGLSWDDSFKHHVATYGPQDKFGYKDFIPMFKADKFDPAHWAKVFKEAGAKYVVPVAEHHDGFAMYDSDFSRWTAAQMGPKKDLIGLEAKAYRDEGLVFGCSSHRAEHWWFMSGGRKFDSDVQDPKYADFYGPAAQDYSAPSEEWARNWLARSCELVDKYHPQVLYFDWWVGETPVFAPYLKKFAAYYYDRAAERGEGVVLNTKDKAFVPGTAVQDVEKGKLPGINPVPWQTDTSVSWKSWAYLKDDQLKDAGYLVRTLIDAVSRNGNLLLDIGPKPDGTIPEAQEKILLQMGDWLKVNGEAIYGTRPWITFGEGPTQEGGGKFSESDVKYQEGDVRFTRKANALYVFCMGSLSKPLTIRSLSSQNAPGVQVKDVFLVGSTNPLKWSQGADGLVLFPVNMQGTLPIVYKVVLDGSAWGQFGLDTGAKELSASAVFQNYGNQELSQKVALKVNGKDKSSKTVTIPAQGSASFSLGAKTTRAGVYQVALACPGQAELAGQTALPLIDLSGPWLFHKGDDASWSDLKLEDKDWEQIKVPSHWSDNGYKCEQCFGWYRKKVFIPAGWKGHSLAVPLGKIDDADVSYWNGEKIGQTGEFPPNFQGAWDKPRQYEVPEKLIRFGEENVIAVRNYNGPEDAGIYDGPLGPIEVK